VTGRRLTRSAAGLRPSAPIRIVHLGLGQFFRAHQAFYTDRAPDAAEWGIAAFGGRSARLAHLLGEQDGAYTLVTRDADDDRCALVGSVARAHPASDHEQWLSYFASAELACVTITVTEHSYLSRPAGGLDRSAEHVQSDIAALRADVRNQVRTVPARLVAGLAARRTAGVAPLTVLPCDNLPGNGEVVRQVVVEMAALIDAALAGWIEETTSFASSMVDRITPPTTPADIELVEVATGWRDECPVVTEPFSEWVIAGEFPAGRPSWDHVGVTLTDDIGPHEQRKLWLLNGAHSLLAYTGLSRGHRTVAEAVADPVCADWMHRWWREAIPYLAESGVDLLAYCDQLTTRFANPRIGYPLAQVAADGSAKLPARILALVRRERSVGRLPAAALTTIAAWIAHVQHEGAAVADPRQAALARIVAGPDRDVVARILDLIAPDLAEDDAVVGWLGPAVAAWQEPTPTGGQ
jgi:fructuronate reductase